jgi:hypothetical protein
MTKILDLPDDTFRYEIFPYLGWHDRVNFNSVLPISHRIATRFKKERIIQHEQYVLIHYLIRIIDNAGLITNPVVRVLYLTNFMGIYATNCRVMNLVSRQPKIKTILIEKALEYSDIDLTMESISNLELAQQLAVVSNSVIEKYCNLEVNEKVVGPYRPISF